MTSKNSITKTCSKCLVEKLSTCFYANKISHDGLYSGCKECKSIASKKQYEKNKEKINSMSKKRNSKNKIEKSSYDKTYRTENKDKLSRYYIENREKILNRQKNYQSKNKGKVNALIAKRKARKLKATPSWSETEKIKCIYEKAAELRSSGLDVHVDHVIPLQGRLVSGLHCFDNLQILSAYDNISKGNSYDPNEDLR